MATWADVERIALGLPETEPTTAWGRPAFGVRGAWFVLDRAPRPDAVDEDGERLTGLVVLHVEDEEAKLRLAADDSGHFLTTPHFARSRMILVRLAQIPVDELAEVMVESWLVRAPKTLARQYLASVEGDR
ncbi:MmcQ/YjbR family DNA-binding protein [Ornithinimicrobium cerasi]|uniref:MmcQ/YjbR family DNA-binding protein n=1 Tax=Ornithinimicrobium cerasi TaxID=2248773 RepID=UPI000F00CA7F|nr:MmcQ/YjbR family DNA-binding protein [Ornithinimicrobium cerasi]